MAKKQVLNVIESAIKNPADYTSGNEKNKLRAAFDILTSETYASIFGSENISLLNMRQTLNSCTKREYKAKQWKIIERLREALRESETSLHASDYSDHTEDIENFIRGPLKQFYEGVK
jgi:hypothetical protein